MTLWPFGVVSFIETPVPATPSTLKAWKPSDGTRTKNDPEPSVAAASASWMNSVRTSPSSE